MLNYFERWLKARKKDVEEEAEMLEIQVKCLEDEVEYLRERADKYEMKHLANRALIRNLKTQIEGLKEKSVEPGQLKSLQLQASNHMLKTALKDLITYSGKVVQEAKHHEMHNVISIHMKRVLQALEIASGEEAVKALQFANKVCQEAEDK